MYVTDNNVNRADVSNVSSCIFKCGAFMTKPNLSMNNKHILKKFLECLVKLDEVALPHELTVRRWI